MGTEEKGEGCKGIKKRRGRRGMAAPVLLGNGLDAPIVCPEESPSAPVGATPRPGDTPTPRRGAGGERKAPCIASLKDNFAVRNFPLRGIDAPTPARGQGLQPYGALTLFFRWRRTLLTQEGSSCQSHKSDDPNRMPFSFRQRAVLLSIHKDSLFSLTCKGDASSIKPTKR